MVFITSNKSLIYIVIIVISMHTTVDYLSPLPGFESRPGNVRKLKMAWEGIGFHVAFNSLGHIATR